MEPEESSLRVPPRLLFFGTSAFLFAVVIALSCQSVIAVFAATFPSVADGNASFFPSLLLCSSSSPKSNVKRLGRGLSTTAEVCAVTMAREEPVGPAPPLLSQPPEEAFLTPGFREITARSRTRPFLFSGRGGTFPVGDRWSETGGMSPAAPLLLSEVDFCPRFMTSGICMLPLLPSPPLVAAAAAFFLYLALNAESFCSRLG
mmetsp:Transcript_28722/g.84708  ORF Transcript_28722/g.84708 Transcript_28722/m.84708 type:complete len:203 (+) Transcript_28722:1033-1641(+)